MATVRYELKTGTKPTKEQIRQIEEAAKRLITYDDDAPKLTPEQLTQFRKADDSNIEDELDEADRQATESIKRYSHEEMFSRIRGDV